MNVAIDGPAGAGKSTIAKEASKRLGFLYVDTGALYRAIGLFVIRQGISLDDVDGIIGVLPKISLSLAYKDGRQIVLLNQEDVSEEIRLPEVSMAAAAVSPIAEVRRFLLELQRDIAKKNSVIMDGRDIGTVILPNSEVKIFLTASDETRAKRRYDELVQKGMDVSFEDVLEDIRKRDMQDYTRKEAPLKKADDAYLLDTSEFTLEESIQAVIDLIKCPRKENG